MLIRKLMPENSDIVRSIAVLIESLSLTSHSMAIAEPPLSFISSATDLTFERVLPTKAILAPRSDRARAIPLPTPCPEPVIRAVLFLKSIKNLCLLYP